MNTKLAVSVVAVLVAAVLFLVLAPRGPGLSSIPDKLGRWFERRDSAAVATLDRQRDSLAAALHAQDSAFRVRERVLEDSLALVRDVATRRQALTVAAKRRADSLVAVMRKHEDDDEVDIKHVEAALAGKDQVIAAQADQLTAAHDQIRLLTVEVETFRARTAQLQASLTEALRQRDGYRKLTRRNWLHVVAASVGTIAVCRSVPEPC